MAHIANPADNNAYAFRYLGGVTEEANVLATLTHGGPLLVAADHVWATMCPNNWDFGSVMLVTHMTTV